MATPLRERIILAVVESLIGGDPVVLIKVDTGRLEIEWEKVK